MASLAVGPAQCLLACRGQAQPPDDIKECITFSVDSRHTHLLEPTPVLVKVPAPPLTLNRGSRAQPREYSPLITPSNMRSNIMISTTA